MLTELQYQHQRKEHEKSLRRIDLRNELNAKGYQTWLIDYAMTNSIQLANLLQHSGWSTGRAQKEAFLVVAREFDYLTGKPNEMRGQYDGNRMNEWANLNKLNNLVRIDIANSLQKAGVPSEVAIATISIMDTVQYANTLNLLGISTESALTIATDVAIDTNFEFSQKGLFGNEKKGWNKLFSDIGRLAELHHTKLIQELSRPLGKGQEKKINADFQNAIAETYLQQANQFNKLETDAANEHNKQNWNYGNILSQDIKWQENHNEVYEFWDALRLATLEVHIEAANTISNLLGNMNYEKSQHDVEVLNKRHGVELANHNILYKLSAKKQDTVAQFDYVRLKLEQQREKTLHKVRSGMSKKLLAIAAAAWLAPGVGEMLAKGVISSLGVTGLTAQTVLQGMVTGMTSSGTTGILTGETKDLAKSMLKGGVLAGIGSYAGEFAGGIKALEGHQHLRTVFVSGVKATAGSLINGDKLGQGLINSVMQGLLLGESEVPKEFLDILREEMLRATVTAMVDTLVNGGPIGDKLAQAGTSSFFQSLGEYAGRNFKDWFDGAVNDTVEELEQENEHEYGDDSEVPDEPTNNWAERLALIQEQFDPNPVTDQKINEANQRLALIEYERKKTELAEHRVQIMLENVPLGGIAGIIKVEIGFLSKFKPPKELKLRIFQTVKSQWNKMHDEYIDKFLESLKGTVPFKYGPVRITQLNKIVGEVELTVTPTNLVGGIYKSGEIPYDHLKKISKDAFKIIDEDFHKLLKAQLNKIGFIDDSVKMTLIKQNMSDPRFFNKTGQLFDKYTTETIKGLGNTKNASIHVCQTPEGLIQMQHKAVLNYKDIINNILKLPGANP